MDDKTLRVWWIANPPHAPLYIPVEDEREAKLILDALAAFDTAGMADPPAGARMSGPPSIALHELRKIVRALAEYRVYLLVIGADSVEFNAGGVGEWDGEGWSDYYIDDQWDIDDLVWIDDGRLIHYAELASASQ